VSPFGEGLDCRSGVTPDRAWKQPMLKSQCSRTMSSQLLSTPLTHPDRSKQGKFATIVVEMIMHLLRVNTRNLLATTARKEDISQEFVEAQTSTIYLLLPAAGSATERYKALKPLSQRDSTTLENQVLMN